MEEPDVQQKNAMTGGGRHPSLLHRFLDGLVRSRLPEALMVIGLTLAAVAGMTMWSQARAVEPYTLAVLQPTPFPTATLAPPMPTPSPTPTAMITGTPGPTRTPEPLPVIPSAPAAVPKPAASAPTRIVIPAIGLDAKIVEVGWQAVERDGQWITEWEVADYAVGFHRGSAYPGNPGNTVLSGHHNVRGKVFRYLVNVEQGDEVVLYADGRAFVYRVESKQIVPEKYASVEQRTRNAQLIGYFPDERLTLVTCWPLTSSTHRVVVVAKPVAVPAS